MANEVWRKDFEDITGGPMGRVVINATDVGRQKSIFRPVIHHVVHHGVKGFMPSIINRLDEGCVATGRVFLGTDLPAYDKALKEVRSMLLQQIKKLNESEGKDVLSSKH